MIGFSVCLVVAIERALSCRDRKIVLIAEIYGSQAVHPDVMSPVFEFTKFLKSFTLGIKRMTPVCETQYLHVQ